MIKKIATSFLFCSLCIATFYAHSQDFLTESASASLLTCREGSDVESFFGHSAIRVCDTSRGIDFVYNYGTYDFDQPHFYWTFARGNLNYCLSRTSYRNFILSYIHDGRAVYEQRLLLTHQQCNNLFLLLETNLQPEYRYYRYDFFRDNCATRPRDLIESTLGHHCIHYKEPDKALSYRDVLYSDTEKHTWWRLALDIVLGTPADHICDTRELMFAPQWLMFQIENATIGEGMPLTDKTKQILPQTSTANASTTSPLVIAWCLFIIILALSILSLHYGWNLRWMDVLLYGVATLIALLLLFLWLGTTHLYTKWNLNLLWASPLWLYFLIRGNKSHRVVTLIQLALLFLSLLTALIGWPQHLNSAIIPISLIYFIRLTIFLYQNNHSKINNQKYKA